MKKCAVIVLTLGKKRPRLYHDLITHFKNLSEDERDQRNIDILESFNDSDAVKKLKEYTCGIILFAIFERSHVEMVTHILQYCSPVMKEGPVRVIGLNPMAKNEITKKLTNQGAEIFSNNVKFKSINLKLDYWNKLFQANNNSRDSGITIGKLILASQNKKIKNESFKFCNPLNKKFDYWQINSSVSYKKIENSWIVKLMGPGPAVGRWQEFKYKNEVCYSFELSDDFKIEGDDGIWIFMGTKPQFVYEEGVWIFRGKNINLFYLGPDSANKIKIIKGQCYIAKNSLDFAKQRSLIQRTWLLKEQKEIVEKIKQKQDKRASDYVVGIPTGIQSFGDVEIDFAPLNIRINIINKQDIVKEVDFLDYLDNFMAFRNVGENNFNIKDEVKIDINYEYKEKKGSYKFKGVIAEIEDEDNGNAIVTVHLMEAEVIAINEFIDICNLKQENVLKFLEVTKEI